jgi:hypothetical protein
VMPDRVDRISHLAEYERLRAAPPPRAQTPAQAATSTYRPKAHNAKCAARTPTHTASPRAPATNAVTGPCSPLQPPLPRIPPRADPLSSAHLYAVCRAAPSLARSEQAGTPPPPPQPARPLSPPPQSTRPLPPTPLPPRRSSRCTHKWKEPPRTWTTKRSRPLQSFLRRTVNPEWN